MVKINKAKMTAALLDSGGIMQTIANRLGVSRVAVYQYLNKYPEFKEMREDETQKILDLAEAKLFNQINKENLLAIKYLLSTKGRSRGYVKRQEIEHSGNTYTFVIDDDKYSDKDITEAKRSIKGSE
jgi:predicted transcriptional regulator